MKTTFLTNLLVVFSLALCGLCTFQWLRETESRKVQQQLHDVIFRQSVDIQNHTNQIHRMDHRIAELTDDVARLNGTVKSNEASILDLNRKRASLEATNDFLGRQVEAYTNAVASLQERLKQAYDDIRKQNDSIKEAVEQRNEFVTKLNTAIQERNDVVKQYNELVERFKQFQEQVEAAQKQQKK
jgi:chromosome segregation ATPase